MPLDVQPGSQINITVTKTPTNEWAAKTLSRIFAKDVNSRSARRDRKKLRTANTDGRQRGGRIWYVRPKAPRIIMPEKDSACTVFASVDVIRDLGCVSRFIAVKPA